MLTEAIASASMDMSMSSIMQQVNVSTTKMAIDSQCDAATELINEMMPQPTSFGHKLDILV